MNGVVFIEVDLLLANGFEVVPFLLLGLTEGTTDWRLIEDYLGDVVDEAGIPCLLTDVDSPHLELL